MNLRKLTNDISVSDQLNPKDLPLVRSLGFRSVICNRPDGESPDQPLYESIRSSADLSGMAAHYLPVASGSSATDSVGEMRRLLRELPRPMLLYCRSGARSASLIDAALAGRADA